MSLKRKNPLLNEFDTPFGTIPFSLIHPEHFLPALKERIAEAKESLVIIKDTAEAPTFQNTIEPLERIGRDVHLVSSVFFNLNSAETSEEIQTVAQEFSPILTEYSNDILLDPKLFDRVKTVFEAEKNNPSLTPEQKTLLKKSYKGFVRNGALLGEEEKTKLREIDKKLSQLTLKFGEHVLQETNDYELVIDNEDDMAGLPGFVKEAAAETARHRNHEDKWVFTLEFPSYIPFVTYADNRELRKQMTIAAGSKAFRDNDRNNEEIVRQIVNLRLERAKVLGYRSHADFILEERMAGSAQQVDEFLDELLKKAKPAGERDVAEVADFAKKTDGIDQLQRWDWAYYAEKLKKEKFDINDEILKPYFRLEKVVDGVFEVAQKLYGLTFTANKDIPVYHPDVTAYEVNDANGKHLAVFYADFFPRATKRNGAWMTSFKGQYVENDSEHRPHVSIVCNFTKPTASTPSLLTFNEVTTLFHEFGHALHGMLANGTYETLSGTNVFWDFVELPSQILENWAYEKECLDIFAKHFETDEDIPADLIQKIKDSAVFMEGYQFVRQISFGRLDMAWHNRTEPFEGDVYGYEGSAMEATELLPKVPGTNMSCSFSHIFQGGYSAGYYSYKWAEVLEADAFEHFKEKGIFDKDTAEKFRKNILSAGGSEHPMTLYKRFRGKEPDAEALLRKAGLSN
ncbi:peptidase M3 (plasmid) [Fulvitalea axinellae]|uniref:Peptidase M3 n=1 Tax=Fulvitalea axinellae TaxID=1182444 RepID=A0AAU9CUJ5_9BACT|nr:peptidase M3 [Fulvitalea axinellae]